MVNKKRYEIPVELDSQNMSSVAKGLQSGSWKYLNKSIEAT